MLDKLKNGKTKPSETVMTVLPPVNIYSQDPYIILDVEMPGVDKSSLNVNIDGNILHLAGTRANEQVDKQFQIIHQERFPVTYKRSFELSADIDRNDLKAEYANGVLKIFLKKSETAQPKKIEIQI